MAYEAEAIRDRKEAAKNPRKALKRRLPNIGKKIAPRRVDKIVTALYGGVPVADELCEVKQISKVYGGQVLFQDLDFKICRGDRLAVVGRNGCEKTTLLKVLGEDVPPDAGQVVWKYGNAYANLNDVLQGLDPDDTVTHRVNTAGLANDAPRRQVNRFLQLLQFAEMDLNQRIGTLSGGQKARVALALSLLSGASVVLLDEPTNHLDIVCTQVMERALIDFPGAIRGGEPRPIFHRQGRQPPACVCRRWKGVNPQRKLDDLAGEPNAGKKEMTRTGSDVLERGAFAPYLRLTVPVHTGTWYLEFLNIQEALPNHRDL